MARPKKTFKTKKTADSNQIKSDSKIRKAAKKKAPSKKVTADTSVFSSPFFERIQKDLKSQQSPSSLILGALIVVVLAILIFNYFNKHAGAPEIDSQAAHQQSQDIARGKTPDTYTVKNGDTLFKIAQAYYNNGYMFQKIADSNKLSDPNNLNVGQVLEIPKLGPAGTVSPQPSPSSTDNATSSDNSEVASSQSTQYVQGGTGGSPDQTEWGERITGNTYTVQEGDWLSKIAGRAYGDIYQYAKIAQANNISNPDDIEVGTVLTIPR